MKVAVQATPRDLRDIPTYCSLGDAGGLDALFFSDGVGVSKRDTLPMADGFTALGAAATASHGLDLGICAASPVMRTPEVIGNAIAGAAAALPDRTVRLCLGAGDTPVFLTGRRPAKLEELTECVELVRAMWTRGKVGLGESRWQVPNARVLVAANGPRTLRMAGAHADGVVIGTGLTPDIVDWAIHRVAEGLRKRADGLDPDHFEIWINGILDIDDKAPQAAVGRATLRLLTRANHNLRSGAVLVPQEERAGVDRFEREYDEGDLGIDSGNLRLVTPYIRERFSVAGDVSSCRRRLADICKPPVTGFIGAIANWDAQHGRDVVRAVGALSRRPGASESTRRGPDTVFDDDRPMT